MKPARTGQQRSESDQTSHAPAPNRNFKQRDVYAAPQRGSAPTPQRGSAPAPQRESTPAPQRGSTPASQRESTPAPQHGSTPAPQRGSAPAPQHGSASIPQRGSAPAPQRDSAPQHGSTPASQRGSTLASQRESAPAPQRGSVSAPQRGSASIPQRGSASASQRGPAPQCGSASAPQRGSASASQRGSASAPRRGPAPQRGSAPAAARGSGDPGQAARGGPMPPVTSHAKKTSATDKRNQAPQDSHTADKNPGGKGGPALPVLRPEMVPPGTDVKLEGGDVDEVELQTRGQRSNSRWFAWRKNRITASMAHDISHSHFVNGKSNTPARSYVENITGRRPRFKTLGVTWGIENEAEAVRRYVSLKSEVLGRPVSVERCGLFIDPQHAWLAASPDGIVELNGERLLILEVKCPYKHRENTVAEACLDRNFCLELLDRPEEREPHYRLKPNHPYYTQIQCQMAVTGLHQADLVVFTLKETAIVPVGFDPEFWKKTFDKLKVFYTDAVLPEIDPAVEPEE